MVLITKLYLGFLAGLVFGKTYIGLYLLVFLPILLSKKQSPKASFFLVLEFSAGRFFGYLFFCLIFGFLGQLIKSDFIHIIFSLATLWLGILMIVYSMGAIDQKFCAALPFSKIKWPFLMGFLIGVNIYPSFLASLTYVFNLKNAILSLVYFFAFFLGTSVYLVSAAFLGIFTKINWLTKIAQVSGVIVGLYFIFNTLFPTGPLPQKTHLSPTSKSTIQLSPTPKVARSDSSEVKKVIRVIDGDTIVLENGKTVRYIGVDAPELHHPKKKVECFAKEAKVENEKLVLGKMVRLEKDVSETDKYGRLLRYVYVDNSIKTGEITSNLDNRRQGTDGAAGRAPDDAQRRYLKFEERASAGGKAATESRNIFVNEYLVKEGFALLATYPPDVKYQEVFQKAQKNAQENNKGLWNKKVCQL